MLPRRKTRERAFFVYQVYARDAMAEGRYKSAILFLLKAISLDPCNAGLLMRLGNAYERAGMTRDALRTYRRIITIMGWESSPLTDLARRAIHDLTAGRAPSPGETRPKWSGE